MAEPGEKPQDVPQADLSRRENLLRFIRLEFQLAETLSALSNQTENKRQRKRLRDDIRKARVSVLHFKKKLAPEENHAEVDEYIRKIDSFLSHSGSPSAAALVLKRLQQRVRKLKNKTSRKHTKLSVES